ncbi:MAG TPA: Holliday junction resolvase RuvX [Acidimicrobiia bacterium]|nr:Holliday junction resolvase RuvX [Acidimicrobiia bacterium]
MGRVLAVDPGTVRVGLAISDPLGITAQPLDVIDAEKAVEEIARLCQELEVTEIVVGLPVTESGDEGASAEMARTLADDIAQATGREVTTLDERYTTRMAESLMIEAGTRRRRRRGAVDKVAAAVLLRSYLDRRGPRE